MAKVIHNTEFERRAKQFLPEGHRLDVDRGYNAKTIETDINKWKKDTARKDLKGFDTMDAKQPTPRVIVKQMGIGYVESEPDRFVRDDQESLRLLNMKKQEILDFQSFKKALNEAWGQDMSLRQLISVMKENDYEALFNTKRVQGWIKDNIGGSGIDIIMRRLNIERERATRVWNKLPQAKKIQLIKQSRGGIKMSKASTEVISKEISNLLRQKSKSGTYYERTKPTKWTALQEKYIINNKNLSIKDLSATYNKIFPNDHRTISSIRNKRYRV